MLLSDLMLEKSSPEDVSAMPTVLLTKELRPPVYSSAELLQGNREAWIEHGQQMYRLRLTHAGKLYLTK